jgi:hypothetical protein
MFKMFMGVSMFLRSVIMSMSMSMSVSIQLVRMRVLAFTGSRGR